MSRWNTLVDATRKALADPYDTKQAFRIADALAFGAPRRLTRRYRRSRGGGRALAERRRLLDTLTDRAKLAALPEGSFGRAYLAFLDSEGITAAGLVQASVEGREVRTNPDEEFVQQQMRDMHDLWHTLTGYKGDLLGEAAVLAFTFAQTRHPGVGFLAMLGAVLSPAPYYRRFIVQGFRRGVRAAWLPGQDWESLLPLPLAEVRRRLQIDELPDYEPVREPLGFAARVQAAA
jgi:ubiquinone biosynthesis protein COQ4